jgi:hypothetical protein
MVYPPQDLGNLKFLVASKAVPDDNFKKLMSWEL